MNLYSAFKAKVPLALELAITDQVEYLYAVAFVPALQTSSNWDFFKKKKKKSVMVGREAVEVAGGKSTDMVMHETEQSTLQSRDCSVFPDST